MALASPEMRTMLAANGSHARDDRDPEAALSILLNSAEKRRNDNAEKNDDHGREAILAMMLSSASTLVQVVYQRQGGGGHNLLSIIAFVVSFFGYLGYNYFSRARISAAGTCSSVRISASRTCSSVALFSASLTLASLLAMPLHGETLKCIPYAICVFPLVSLLSSFYSCLKGSQYNPPTSTNAADFPSSSLPISTTSSGSIEMAAVTPTTTVEALVGDACGLFCTSPSQEEAADEGSLHTFANLPAAIRISNQPIQNPTASGMEMALLLPTVTDAVANATAPRDEEEASVAEDDGHQVEYYNCFVS